jgi:propanediol dehydratase small subunit
MCNTYIMIKTPLMQSFPGLIRPESPRRAVSHRLEEYTLAINQPEAIRTAASLSSLDAGSRPLALFAANNNVGT